MYLSGKVLERQRVYVPVTIQAVIQNSIQKIRAIFWSKNSNSPASLITYRGSGRGRRLYENNIQAALDGTLISSLMWKSKVPLIVYVGAHERAGGTFPRGPPRRSLGDLSRRPINGRRVGAPFGASAWPGAARRAGHVRGPLGTARASRSASGTLLQKRQKAWVGALTRRISTRHKRPL